MSKILGIALVLGSLFFIFKNLKDIIDKAKEKRSEKAKEKEKECDTVNLESENPEGR